MRESPSHALRACRDFAEEYPPLAKSLFNVAFLSCWTELNEVYQEELKNSLLAALASPFVSADVTHALLNLFDFMEREDKGLPIHPALLGEYAMRIHAYGKVLHYKEIEFATAPSSQLVDALINVNTKLQQPDAAWGLLNFARDGLNIAQQHQESWYEMLGKWQDALTAYEKRSNSGADSAVITMGKMRCLHALGEWEQLSDYVQQSWTTSDRSEQMHLAPLGAAAAWSLNRWQQMSGFIQAMRHDSPDRYFYQAIFATHNNNFSQAISHIYKARAAIQPELSSKISESYGRAYQ